MFQSYTCRNRYKPNKFLVLKVRVDFSKIDKPLKKEKVEPKNYNFTIMTRVKVGGKPCAKKAQIITCTKTNVIKFNELVVWLPSIRFKWLFKGIFLDLTHAI